MRITSSMRTIFLFAIISFFHTNFSFAQNTYSYVQPAELEDGWKTADLSLQNVDMARVNQLFTQLQQGENKLHSVVLVKNGEIVIEEYLNDFSLDQPHDLRSATKSVRSILLGIAIEKGFIDDIDDPISKYLKPQSPKKNKDPRKDSITIRHLVTMSPGLDCNDWDKKSKGQEDRVYRKKDWIQYTLDLPMINVPGTVSNYCSMGTLLVAEIISRASGMTIDKFAEKYLFQPLGISNVTWGHTSKKVVIPSGKRLYMTPRDMAKIGQLILNEGSWHGDKVISDKWIKESTSPKTKITGMEYGYLWWNVPFRINEEVTVATVATGNGGQYIMVFPDMDMVAVFTGAAYNSQEDKLPFAIMNDVLLPTFAN